MIVKRSTSASCAIVSGVRAVSTSSTIITSATLRSAVVNEPAKTWATVPTMVAVVAALRMAILLATAVSKADGKSVIE